MKLLIQNNKIVGEAQDNYNGPEMTIESPPGFVFATDYLNYTVVNNALVELPIVVYNGLISGGLTLTSTGTPALNGTYAVDTQAQHNISSIMSGIANGLGLPGGGSTFTYQDQSGVSHSFDATHFSALAKAVRDFVYNCDITLATIVQGGTATYPINSIVIP